MYTRDQITDAIHKVLDERERKIINFRFGIDDGITKTLVETELQLGALPDEVRQIEKKVLIYLREHFII